MNLKIRKTNSEILHYKKLTPKKNEKSLFNNK